MQKNWYIIYTKPKCEKKVAATFSKRKIENFFPLNCREVKSLRKRKFLYEPLFDSYVFANMFEEDIKEIMTIDGVLNLVYWKGKPAIMREDEIEVIKEFTSDYQEIRLEKTRINPNEVARIIDGPDYSMEGNILKVKNNVLKVNLPSIGFNMIAEVSSENALGRKVLFGNKDLLLQS